MRNPRTAPAFMAFCLAASLAACTGSNPGSGNSAADDTPGTDSPPVTVFAAASMSEVMDGVGGAYAGAPLRLNIGSSSQLSAQVLSGAQADVIITADEQALEPLWEAGLLERETLIARNRMVLAVAPGNPAGVDALSDLADAAVQAAACAQSVPCGRAAQRVLDGAGVSLRGESREDDVRSVLTKVSTGQADAGLVYLTDALAAAGQGVTRIELDDPAPNRYPAALTAEGAQDPAAVAFYDWLAGGGADGVLREAGFEPAGDRPAANGQGGDKQ